MMAINEMTADAMLGTPDSDLWHNVDDLLHNVNDLMSRLDPEPSKTESGQSGSDEGEGGFFAHDPPGNLPADKPTGASVVQQQYYEIQVSKDDTACSNMQLWSNAGCLVSIMQFA